MNQDLHSNLNVFQGLENQVNQPVKDFFQEWLTQDQISVFTSGSTGTPKKILLDKKAMVTSASQTIRFFDINPTHYLLLCMPVDFIAGKMMVVRALVSKATLVYIPPSVNPLSSPLAAQMPPIYFAAFTPQQVAAMVSDAGTRKLFESIDKVIIGGGEIPPELEKKLAGFPNEIYATYGMTETITHIAMRKIGNPDRIYKVFKGVRTSIDERQCLTLQADYLGKEPIITNDIVELQGPHEFTWLGRYDNVVNSGGIKLFPEKIEAKIRDLIPHHFFVAGMHDAVLGEKLVLLIEGEPYDAVTLGLLKSSLKDLLDKYEVPKDIFFLPVFERTGTDKIQRKRTVEKIKE